MNLDEEQKSAVSGWIAEGRSVSEIQDLLRSELALAMTYMEVRFLVDDLGLQLKDAEPEPDPEPEPGPAAEPEHETQASESVGEPAGQAPPAEDDGVPGEEAEGSVSLTVDKITRPGAIVSGSATFSDGNKAEWMLDQMGRLGVVPEVEGYKPSAGDVAAFQASLQEELQKLGF